MRMLYLVRDGSTAKGHTSVIVLPAYLSTERRWEQQRGYMKPNFMGMLKLKLLLSLCDSSMEKSP